MLPVYLLFIASRNHRRVNKFDSSSCTQAFIDRNNPRDGRSGNEFSREDVYEALYTRDKTRKKEVDRRDQKQCYAFKFEQKYESCCV